MNSEKLLKQTSWAFAVALCGMCVITGCGKSEGEKSAEISPSSPASYMHDKAFMAKCDEMEKEKRGIMKRFSAARRELEAERAKDPKSARVAELEKLLKALEEEHQKNKRDTQALVRERLSRDNNLKK